MKKLVLLFIYIKQKYKYNNLLYSHILLNKLCIKKFYIKKNIKYTLFKIF